MKKPKPLAREDLEHVGESIITLKGTDKCLGDLIYFPSHGTFCPYYGKVPVTQEEADIHNKAFDKAKIDGLDRCPVGKGAVFYYYEKERIVKTFIGTRVSQGTSISGKKRKTIYFHRGDMEFKGVLRKDQDCFFAKRVR